MHNMTMGKFSILSKEIAQVACDSSAYQMGACYLSYRRLTGLLCHKMSVSSVPAAKAALRKETAKKLSELSDEVKFQQSKAVHAKLFNLPAFIASSRISVFLSTDQEISTKEIVERIFADKKSCFVPRYTKECMEMVKLVSMDDWEKLPLTKWHIKQPSPSENRENALDTGGLDLIIAPGVAFTKNGDRLGHGKGYYDTYFESLRNKQTHKVTTVGLAFKEQVLESIPTTQHDVKLDVVLYPD